MKTKKDVEKGIEDFINKAKDVQMVVTQPQPNTVTVIDTVTVTGTDTGTLLDTLIEPTEYKVRHVCYLNENQSKFVKSMAKKYNKKESDIFRMALDYFMKNQK